MMERLQDRRVLRWMAALGALALAVAMVPAGVAMSANAADDDVSAAEVMGTPVLCGPQQRPAFPDVDADGVFTYWINCLAGYDIVQGRADGSFGPSAHVTRAQMAKFIVNLVEKATGTPIEVGPDDRFPDVTPDSAFATFIDKLAASGIAQGYASGEYGPSDDVRRDQLATFVRNAIEYVLAASMATDGQSFPDVAPGNPHEGAIDALATAAIVEGRADGTYGPSEHVRRGQMAKFIAEAMGHLLDEGGWPLSGFEVQLSWANEVDTSGALPLFFQGEPDTEGFAILEIDAALGCVGFEVIYDEVTGPFGAAPGLHLHAGEFDENGPIVVDLASGTDLDAAAADADPTVVISGEHCFTLDDPDPRESSLIDSVLYDILDDPEGFYVNLHSDAYPAGAVRGQLPFGGQDLIPEVLSGSTPSSR
jgi:hypothetical protein